MGTAMFTGVTGLLAHQRKLDVVANNIANVNTVGYRSSRILFRDLFSQTLSGGSAPATGYGGENPQQVGLGVGIASIDVMHYQGSLFTTGNSSDLAIEGSGFFILSNGGSFQYTRDGSFALNANGELIEPGTGAYVQGYMADSTGTIDPDAEIENLVIPLGETSIVQATSTVSLTGNLDASAEVGDTIERSVQVYDSQGSEHEVRLTFTKIDQVDDGSGTLRNAWTYTATYDGTDVTNVLAGETGALLFDTDGNLVAEGSLDTGTGTFTDRSALPSELEISIPATLFTGASVPETPLEFSLDFSTVTELGSTSDVTVTSQDGYPRGVLETFEIGSDGTIVGVFTNGLTQVMGQMAIATFANVGGLARGGDNTFVETSASGAAQIGQPNSGGRGAVSGGVLEASNVDLGTELSNMILTQRGYQANARTFTAADTLLQEAVNLVR